MIIDWTSYLNQWQFIQGQYVSDAISTPRTTFVDTYMSYISASEWLLTVVDGESVSRFKKDAITLIKPVTINDNLVVDGNVGIGIDTPLSVLHVYTTGANNNLLLESGTDSNTFMTFKADGAEKFKIGYEQNSTSLKIAGSSLSGDDFLVVNSLGDVGIGTGTPLRVFHSYHATDNITGLFESGDPTVFITMQDSDSLSNNHVRVGAVGDDLVLWAGQLERARIASNGSAAMYGTLDVSGKLTTGSGRVEKINPLAKTANYTILDTDHNTWSDTSGGAFWNKLPLAPNIGERHNIILDTIGNTLTVDGNGQNINGSATWSMTTKSTMQLIYNGNQWDII